MATKQEIYRMAQQKLGYDRQMCIVAESASLTAGEACRIVNYKHGERGLAEAIANLEIAIEQLRHNGLDQLIEHFKRQKLAQLANRLNLERD